MAILEENLGKFDAALARLENETKETRRMILRVRTNLAFEGDLAQSQINKRLVRVTPLAAKLQAAVTAAQTIFQATEPIVDD